MAIMWSNRQTAECTWFVSLNGYDTVSAWNAYLLSQSLPQDCTAANIGSSTYPYRTWAQVVADSRAVTGEKVAVGAGKWGSDAQRTVWTKSMYWQGMTGTVIDMQLCSSYVFRALVIAETYDNIVTINGIYANVMSAAAGGIANLIRCYIDYLVVSGGSAGVRLYVTDCIIQDGGVVSLNNRFVIIALRCTFIFDIRKLDYYEVGASRYINCIAPIQPFNSYYCCIRSGAVSSVNYNFVGDPLFNNAAIGDYTLRSDSPCLYNGKNGAHIGALGEARTINPNSPEMANGVAIYSLTGGLTDLIKTSYEVGGVTMYMLSLRTGKMSGTVEADWIDLGRTREVDSLRFVADMIYGAGGNYAQAPSPDLNKLSVSYKAALTEAEKAGVSWVSTEWGAEDLAVSARYIKLLITVTSTTPAP